ncbi:right-handed parallel beta-helix repeat-containing protein [Candidatus Acetothermia bacterium]|nr:right-handed parallel beta-helix repeat-containing protein [Candidatus Acetothermia bacterium]
MGSRSLKIRRGCLFFLIIITLALANNGRWGGAQPECDTTVQPGDPIQASINMAPSGAVICLGAGIFLETVEITRSVTLHGAGQERTYLEISPNLGLAVLHIDASVDILVTIEGLTVTSTLSVPTVGVSVSGRANVTLKDVRVCDVSQGLLADGAAQVTLSNSLLCRNSVGLLAKGFSQTSLSNTPVTSNNFGVDAKEAAQVAATNSAIRYNRLGFLVSDTAFVMLGNSQVSDNGAEGLLLLESSKTEIQGSTISDNGFLRECRVEFCNGIELSGQAQLRLADSVVASNTDWGIGSTLKQCGYAEDEFTGSVSFKGHNMIEHNNKLGKQDGAGNPGNHTFKNGPSGQVCVP